MVLPGKDKYYIPSTSRISIKFLSLLYNINNKNNNMKKILGIKNGRYRDGIKIKGDKIGMALHIWNYSLHNPSQHTSQ